MNDGSIAGIAPSRLTPAVLPLFRELGDLKRIRSAGWPNSVAERLFVDGWAALAGGMQAGEAMARIVAAAMAAARLGDLDLATLEALGSGGGVQVLERSFDGVAGVLDEGLRDRLRAALGKGAPHGGSPPAFALKLSRQPRAGVTCPGRPRVLLQPAENHAEHCLVTALYAAIASPWFGADPAVSFVSAMAHHLHNADMPDSGFAGEMLLGGALDGMVTRARDRALGELPAAVAAYIRRALAPIAGDATPEARVFHAGDVLDRVLEIEQHLRAGQMTLDLVMGEYGLVHDGPVKKLHDRILAEAGLG